MIGKSWTQYGATFRVVESGRGLDLGFLRVSGVVVVELNAPEVERHERLFFAPGLGVVRVEGVGEKLIGRQLRAVELVDSKEVHRLARQG